MHCVREVNWTPSSTKAIFICYIHLSPRSYSNSISCSTTVVCVLLNLFAYVTLKYLISQLDAVAPTVKKNFPTAACLFSYIFIRLSQMAHINAIIAISPIDRKSISKPRGPTTFELSRGELWKAIEKVKCRNE